MVSRVRPSLLTGVFGFCITYRLLGISTAKRRAANQMAD
jgi:hypothetical protein